MIDAVTWIITRLKTLSIPVHRIHTDKAREFLLVEFQNWINEKEIARSCTAGDKPQSNGRVESDLGMVRGMARTMMRASSAEENMWPLASRTASEIRFRRQLHRQTQFQWVATSSS